MPRSITIDDLYLFKQISRPRISPDGQQVAYVVTTIDKSTQKYCSSIWISSVDSGDARRFTGGASNAHSPCWSPDGKNIAFTGGLKTHSGGHLDLYTISAHMEHGSATCLSHDFEGTFQDWTNSDIGDEHLSPPPSWSQDGRTLYALASHRGASRIYAITASGSGDQMKYRVILNEYQALFKGLLWVQHAYLIAPGFSEPQSIVGVHCNT